MNNHRSDIALFRYALIRQACDPGVTKSQRGVIVRELASTPHRDPLGRHVMISRGTLDRWVRSYLAGGFEALHPKPLARMATTPVELLELAVGLKTEEPTRNATQVAMLIAATKGLGPSARTLQRHFRRLGLDAAPGSRRVFGRFEAPVPNDRWIGDGLHGCVVGDSNTMLFVFLDDHSRLITGKRWFMPAVKRFIRFVMRCAWGSSREGCPIRYTSTTDRHTVPNHLPARVRHLVFVLCTQHRVTRRSGEGRAFLQNGSRPVPRGSSSWRGNQHRGAQPAL